jgi:ribosome-associated translation inhibitor RaiA
MALAFPTHALEQHALQAEGFNDDDDLDEAIKKLESELRKAKKKDADGDEGAIVSFPIPQHTLLG